MFITIVYTMLIYVVGLSTNMFNEKSRKRYMLFSGVLLVLISGLRSYNLGTDTMVYYSAFEDVVQLSFRQICDSEFKDPFYYIFSKFLSLIVGNNFHLVLLVFAAMYMSTFGKLIYKESPNLLISFIVFISLGLFSFSMHGVRQGLAIAFIMSSYFPLRDKKILKFIGLVLIASLFHSTAIIFLIAYPCCRLGFNKKSAILYIGILGVLLVSGDNLVRTFALEASAYDARFEAYAVTEKSLTYSGFIQLCLFFLLVLFNMKSFKEKDKDSSLLITLLVLALIFQSCSIFIAEMFRIAMYFSIFLVILVPRVLATYPVKYRKEVSFIICILIMMYFYSEPYKLEYSFFWNDPYQINNI